MRSGRRPEAVGHLDRTRDACAEADTVVVRHVIVHRLGDRTTLSPSDRADAVAERIIAADGIR